MHSTSPIPSVTLSVTLTSAAAAEIQSILTAQELPPDTCLKIGVKGFGPNRQFSLDLSEQDPEHDILGESQGIRLNCRSRDLPQLENVTIDFRDVSGSRGFVFKLPEKQSSTETHQVDPSQGPPTEQAVWEALHEVIDPEVGVNVVDLGLVYGLEITGRQVRVTMTMTTPACPLSEQIKRDVNNRVLARCPGTESVQVDIVWEPKWTPDKISEEAKKALGWSR